MTLSERYDVHERVGEGGMALVYRATDRRLNRDVAVKMLRPQYAGDPDFVARFEQEARAAAALSHPYIAAVYDTGQDGETHYIVMELLRPFTLKDLIARSDQGRLRADEVVRYAVQVAAALGQAHAKGVVHRDIKPQNILFTDDGNVKVTDFGIARALAATSGTATGTILGSPHYLSPEQASGAAATPASDLYSLGVVMFEMLTGRPPFTGETPVAIAVQHLRDTPPAVTELAPDVPPGLAAVVERAMRRNPAERYGTADELRAALDDALSAASDPDRTVVMPRADEPLLGGLAPADEAAEEVVEPYRRQPPRPPLSPAAAWSLALLVLASVWAGIYFSNRQPPGEPVPESPAVEITQPKQIEVPNLRGQDVDAARDWLAQYYQAKEVIPPQVVEGERRDNPAPENQVLEQDPPAGALFDEGSVIRVVVSTGKTPTLVPDLVGSTVAKAKEELEANGLALGTISQAYSDTYVADVVSGQSVPASGTVAEGTAINLIVSLGPRPAPVEVEPEPAPKAPGDGPGATPPTLPEVSLSIGQPTATDSGLRSATVVVAVPTTSPARKIELRWLSGGEGNAASGMVQAGEIFKEEVRGIEGAVLGVFVDGVQKGKVQY